MSKNEMSWKNDSWRGAPNAPNDESRVDQSWLSNDSRTQASTRTNQFNSYFEEEDADDAYEELPDTYIDDNADK